MLLSGGKPNIFKHDCSEIVENVVEVGNGGVMGVKQMGYI